MMVILREGCRRSRTYAVLRSCCQASNITARRAKGQFRKATDRRHTMMTFISSRRPTVTYTQSPTVHRLTLKLAKYKKTLMVVAATVSSTSRFYFDGYLVGCSQYTIGTTLVYKPSGVFRIWQRGAWRPRIAEAYNRGLGAEPPAEFRGRAPGRGVRGLCPLKLKHFLLLNVQWKPQILSFFSEIWKRRKSQTFALF